MYLLEHHGKELLAARGLSVPAGVLVGPHGKTIAAELPSGPWMVKAQVAAGGRGKAGAVQGGGSLADIARILAELSGTTGSGKPLPGFRIGQRLPLTPDMYFRASAGAAGAHIP